MKQEGFESALSVSFQIYSCISLIFKKHVGDIYIIFCCPREKVGVVCVYFSQAFSTLLLHLRVFSIAPKLHNFGPISFCCKQLVPLAH